MANMFNEDGTYNKTEWKAGDKITAVKLNKIELSLEAINNNDIDRHVEADSRLDALEEQAAGKNEVINERIEELNDLVLDNKDELDLEIYGINSRMTFLKNELNEGIADMEAMVAEVEADLEGLHDKDEEFSEQLTHKVNKNPFYVVTDLTSDGINEKIKECVENGGGTVLLQATNDDVIIDKYINVPCKVTLDFSHNKIVVSDNPELKNGFIFGMNTSDGYNWDVQYSTNKCEIRNAFIEAWKSPLDTKGVHVLSKMANINNIKFYNFRQAIVKDKYYTDLFTIDKCDFDIHKSRYNNDYLITIGSNGDGLLINQAHFYTGDFNEVGSVYRNGIYITGCGGGKLTNIINGNMGIYNSSELTIENYHSESGIFNISNSSLTIKNSSFLNTKNNHFITLGSSTDAYNGRCNKITLDNVYFSFTNNEEFRPQKQIFDINILDNSLLNIRNCFRRCGHSLLGISIARNGESFDNFNKLSSKSSLNCNIIADKILNDYSFNTFGGDQNSVFKLSSGSVDWNSNKGTYYYIFQVLFDEDRKLSTISNEVSFNTTGSSIDFSRGSYCITNCLVRIYRGTNSNRYSHYVDLPIMYEWNNVITDFGNDISGCYWISLPSPVTRDNLVANNNPCNQIEINNINIKAYTGSKPSKGSWKKGDRVYNNFSGSAYNLGWVYNGSEFIDM